MKKFLCLFPLLTAASLCLYAQEIKKVEGEYTYYAPDNITLEQAKNTAVERARLQALSAAFGMSVSQTSSTVSGNRNGDSELSFFTSGGTEVKGEWLEDLREPEFSIFYEDGMLCIKVKVSGRAREIADAGTDIDVRILKNGTDLRDESDMFRDGDDLYMYFRTPASGFLAVYFADAPGNAFCLLPYLNDTSGSRAVAPDRDYMFFSAEKADTPEKYSVDEYTMTCNGSGAEQNTVYVIFSIKGFTKANGRQTDNALPRELPFKEFQDWLVRNRIKDRTMTVVKKTITVLPADY